MKTVFKKDINQLGRKIKFRDTIKKDLFAFDGEFSEKTTSMFSVYAKNIQFTIYYTVNLNSYDEELIVQDFFFYYESSDKKNCEMDEENTDPHIFEMMKICAVSVMEHYYLELN